MELPAVDALRQRAPTAHITALAAPPADQLFDGDPRVDETVTLARWGLTHRWDRGNEETSRAIREWLEAERFDLVLDPIHAAPVVAEAVWGSELRVLAGDEAAERRELAVGGGAVEAIGAAVRDGWGLEIPSGAVPRIHISPANRRWAGDFLATHFSDGRTPVALSAAASLALKRWPAERYGALVRWLVEQQQRPVLLFAGEEDETARQVLAACGHTAEVLLAEKLHLQRVAALLERCALFVGNDTGLLHIAAAAGVPCIALFGPTVPAIYLPRSVEARALGGGRIPCPHRNPHSLHPPGCWSEGWVSDCGTELYRGDHAGRGIRRRRRSTGELRCARARAVSFLPSKRSDSASRRLESDPPLRSIPLPCRSGTGADSPWLWPD